ncbi:BREX-1 system adenine-specific DNA-methyltransferase PglX [Sulfurisoma sediminicola]|uniref:site-specific DNA-methyltransferase (adenine-specific) n=1 Tax=Sulfurisoma sediminicola TaxID=1381557 RepID=A0A497XDJ4_9PROT|nr:BREX-1 system adenine-specific DNA-methyltransferase PglX [Sulfurisoma sediminicola]RLJ64759.1 hypothetical protein DFR35_1405 [Sulfurisoma sediminicola]
MAFDQSTRNRLQRFVSEARSLLSDEFTKQLQNDYGLDPVSGEVAAFEKLTHLTDAQRETARILRELLQHYLAQTPDGNKAEVLDRIVREQAFTVLNRLCALRMAEARGLLYPSVSACDQSGYQSQGFQLYARMAGTGLGETGEAYCSYLFSVFDELSQDLPLLFDRYSPHGRLFPREATLLQLLGLINATDIDLLWTEDETIGWIYQYFNSKEERKAMRDASQAPRNSRELAVRNQFFTPRYVVEFLVDNTLGRLWFNATGGKSALAGRCQYLLIKPNEEPEASTRLRDPRTLKLLDPACGSMHFGLYAFDLLTEIYREAWEWEQEHGPGSLDVSTQPQANFQPLKQAYGDEAAFLRDVPRLIIEHNIHGVDIDPRAAQIASLALWLRAQRAWHDADIKAKDRPLVGRGQVVAAIAPPAEQELRLQFAANLDKLDAELFEKTIQVLKDLPELGILLQVERELPHLIRQIYVGKGAGLFAQQEHENWRQAETRLRLSLTEFAHTVKATFQGRLFAQDSLELLRMIDLTREKFDVIVMNPPFGESSASATQYLKRVYALGRPDLYMCFFLRCAKDLLAANGFQGQITSRTFHTLEFFEPMRRELLTGETRLQVLADLGSGVLDGATVETSAYIASKGASSAFYSIDLSTTKEKQPAIARILSSLRNGESPASTWVREHSWFLEIPNGSLCYWLPTAVEIAIKRFPQFDPGFACKPLVEKPVSNKRYGKVRQGLIPGDIFRFTRLRWEVPGNEIGNGLKWVPMMKGGEFRRYFSNENWLFLWDKDGRESKAFAEQRYGGASRTIKNESEFFKPGITFPRVSSVGMNGRLMPKDSVFSDTGMAIIPEDEESTWNLLALFNSRLADIICAALHPGRKFEVAHLAAIPMEERVLKDEGLCRFAQEAYGLVKDATDENAIYEKALKEITSTRSVQLGLAQVVKDLSAAWKGVADRQYQIDLKIFDIYGIPVSEQKLLAEYIDRLRGADESSHEIESVLRPEGYSAANYDAEKGLRDCLSILINRLITAAFSRAGENGHSPSLTDDLLTLVVGFSKSVLGVSEDAFIDDVARFIPGGSLQDYFSESKGFFEDHLTSHSLSPRKAPILWPLSTRSGSYTLWLFYPTLTNQTLYTAINDFIEAKLKQVGAGGTALRNRGSSRTHDEEKQFETLQAFELELIELRDTLLGIAQGYQPNHDDGVQITAAPLWPLFRHKPWQKVLKDTWAKLEKGDYDWAHLAMSYWPARVREKCKTDKSLAIAHGLEDLYIEPEAKPKKTRRKKVEEV